MTVEFGALLRVLSEGGVDFIVIGGVAAFAHGAARNTVDLDVAYSRTTENIDRLTAALTDLYGVRCRVLNLDTLITVKRAAGRPKDFEAIAELEIIRDLQRNRADG